MFTHLRRKFRLASLTSGWWLLAALASCQPEQPRQAAPPPKPAPLPAPTPPAVSVAPAQLPPYTPERQAATEALHPDTFACPPQPLRFTPLTTKRRPRRYQGTVGGEQATAELSWSRPDSVTGSFYWWRRDAEYQLRASGRRHGPVVFLQPDNDEHPDGAWYLTAPLGPVLRGVWVDAAGRRRALVLHESYADAVPYEIQSLTLTGGKPESGGVEGFACAVPELTQQYLHLLAPAAARRPALRRRLAPAQAMRRQLMLGEYDYSATSLYGVWVRLNGFQLLSYATYYEAMPFGGRPQNETTGTLIDLRTGRELVLSSQLIANYRPRLRRLVAQHLLHDTFYNFANYPGFKWQWQENPPRPGAPPDTTYSTSLWTQRELAPLTNEAVLTSAGLELTYWPGSLANVGSTLPDETVLVPYHELRPLVRPGTPLARMLAARGLW